MKRKMQRRMKRPSRKAMDKVTVMVPVFLPIFQGISVAAKELGTDPVQLIHNTLAQGLTTWLKEKEKDSLIQVPGMSVSDRLREELSGKGKNQPTPPTPDRGEGAIRVSPRPGADRERS